MEFNRLWLTCDAHPDTENGIILGQRRMDGYGRAPTAQMLDRWHEQHKNCCDYPDHYRLAHSKTPNWEMALSADTQPVKKAVKLALVNDATTN